MFIPATELVPEYVATTWWQPPTVTPGVCASAKVLSPVPNRPSAKLGLAAPAVCKSAHPEPPCRNFASIVPEEFDVTLNQPDSENESVRSKLKLAGLARLAHVFPSKFTLPPISPGCCRLLCTAPFMVALLPLAVESFNCGAAPAGFSFMWYTAIKLLLQVAPGVVWSVVTA